MLRSVDVQQMLLQTPLVSKVQQQGAHGAEIEQSKLAGQQLAKEEKQQRDIREVDEAEPAGLAVDNPRQEGKHTAGRDVSPVDPGDGQENEAESCRRPGGFFIDLEI